MKGVKEKVYCDTILNRVHKDVKCMLYRLIHEMKLKRVNKEYNRMFILTSQHTISSLSINTLYNYRFLVNRLSNKWSHVNIYKNIYKDEKWDFKKVCKLSINY